MKSHDKKGFSVESISKIGKDTIIETGVIVFHPENIIIDNNVYVGHNTILKAYHKNKMIIGKGTWIGQQCFFHSAGGINIGKNVGFGPGTKIITSIHEDTDIKKPIIHEKILFKQVIIEENCDIGVNAVIMPGVILKRGTQVGAGAVVTQSFPEFSVIAGVPAKLIRTRK